MVKLTNVFPILVFFLFVGVNSKVITKRMVCIDIRYTFLLVYHCSSTFCTTSPFGSIAKLFILAKLYIKFFVTNLYFVLYF